MRDRVSEPGRLGVNRQFPAIRENLTEDVEFFKQCEDNSRGLYDLDGERDHMVRNAVGKAALGGIGRIVTAVPGDLRVKLFRRGQHGDLRAGGHEAFKASAFGIGELAAGEPDSAEVGMAIGSARRWGAEIGLAIIGARRTRQRQVDPLGLRGEGQAQGEEKARDEVREFHYALFCLPHWLNCSVLRRLNTIGDRSQSSWRRSDYPS